MGKKKAYPDELRDYHFVKALRERHSNVKGRMAREVGCEPSEMKRALKFHGLFVPSIPPKKKPRMDDIDIAQEVLYLFKETGCMDSFDWGKARGIVKRAMRDAAYKFDVFDLVSPADAAKARAELAEMLAEISEASKGDS